jgi:copper chaperone
MTIQLTIPDMACAVCAGKIEKAVQSIDPGAEFQADPVSKLVTIVTAGDKTQIQQAIQAAGYHPQ